MEKEINVKVGDKDVTVVVGEISWWDFQDLIDECSEVTDKGPKIKMGKLMKEIVRKSIKEIRGSTMKPENLMKVISRKDAKKIADAAVELNPLEEIF